MKKMLKETIKADIYRYFGDRKKPLILPIGLKYTILFRKASLSKNRILRTIYKFKLEKMSRNTHLQIPAGTSIGKGLYIAHFGLLTVNPRTVIGKNCNLAPGVLIGKTNSRGGKEGGVPVIGNNVWIGNNAIVVGKITVGDDVLIAPGAYVNCDIPSHSIVIGNPARIIHKENACENYINRTV